MDRPKLEETNGPRIVISLSIVTGISLLLMLVRFFCKARYGKKFGWDDHLLSASWVSLYHLHITLSMPSKLANKSRRNNKQLSLLTYTTLTIAAVNSGIGRRLSLIPPENLATALKLLYIGRFFGIVALAVSKSSFAVTLLQLVRGPQVWQRVVIWGVLGSLNVVLWVCGFSLFFMCTPVRKAWDLGEEGVCWDARVQVFVGIGAGGEF